MPLDDDDNPSNAPIISADPAGDADDEGDDALFDMQLFASMFHKKGIATQTIRKGQKDFESHGTRAQDSLLENSRNVIEGVLNYTRVHKDDWNKGYYYPDYWPQALEAIAAGTAQSPARPEFVRDIDPSVHVLDRVVVMDDLKGPQSRTVGRHVRGLKPPTPAVGKVWLLPEEALFMLERGSLDLWWTDRELSELMPSPIGASAKTAGTEEAHSDPEAELEQEAEFEKGEGQSADEFADGIPLSLQAAYAMFIGMEDERGKIALPKYQVYAHLRRLGYFVQRAPDSDQSGYGYPAASTTSYPASLSELWQWLFSLVGGSASSSFPSSTSPQEGPLVRPGLYRNYRSIYQQLELVPRYKPTAAPSGSRPAENPFKVFFHVWSPSKHSVFSKSDPPPPDFRIAVADARDTFVPTSDELEALFDSTPFAPPNSHQMAPGRMYPRLKNGYRNVLISIVDRGLVNFMRFGQSAFGEERLYERFDGSGRGRGGKRGGRRGGRGGRGRGRGR